MGRTGRLAEGDRGPRPHTAPSEALGSTDLQDKLAAQGAEVAMSSPEQLVAAIRNDLAEWAKVVKTSGAQID